MIGRLTACSHAKCIANANSINKRALLLRLLKRRSRNGRKSRVKSWRKALGEFCFEFAFLDDLRRENPI